MPANVVRLRLMASVPSADLLDTNMYGAGAVIRTQSATSETGTYADITGDTTVPLVSGTESYTAHDPLGTSATWYRSRFENAGGTRLSDWSAAKPTTYP